MTDLLRRAHAPVLATLPCPSESRPPAILSTTSSHRLPELPPTTPPPHTANMSAPDPKEAWNRIQNELAKRTSRFGGAGGGGPPKGLGGGVAGLFLLGGGIWLANNALFNGALPTPASRRHGKRLTCAQSTVATEQSNTPG